MSSSLVALVLTELEDSNIVDQAVDSDNGASYTTIRTSSSLEQIKAIIREAEMDGFGSCRHMHDCCGCYFLNTVFVLPLYQDQKDYFLIKEVWGINV